MSSQAVLGHARLYVLALIGAGIVLNVVIGQLVRNVFHLPIYLDSIGTILAGALGGPLAGAATGALSNLVWGLIFNDPGIVPYALTAACIGACASAAAMLGAFKSLPATLLAGLITGAIAALVSAPITAYIQQGASGGGTVALREVLASTSDNLLQAVTLQGFVSDPLDKALSFLAVFVLLRVLPRSILDRFTEARSFSRSKRVSARYGAAVVLSLLALICVWVFRPAFGTSIYAIFFLAVVLSAWYGGLGPGILAGCVGVLANLVYQSPPLGPGLGVEDWLRIIIFVAVAFLVALITARLDRTNSALVQALAEQRAHEAQTRAVVNGVVEALLLVSPAEQRVLSVNRQFEALFSLDSSQVVDRRLDELQPQLEQIFAEPDALLERVAGTSNDQAATFTETFKQVWPQDRLLELFSAPVLSDDHFLGRLFGFRDVTQERELDRMKTEFVSQVSHELRTPLTAIKGFTDMVLDGDAGDVNEEQASSESAAAVASALTQAARTISIMPATFTRYPNSGAPVFGTVVARAPPIGEELVLDADLLRAYGTLTVPGHVWRAMQRLGAWIEPVLVAEWARLVRAYGERMGRVVAPGEVEQALVWLDPAHDTALARAAAQRLIGEGRTVRCVWTGARLPPGGLDIDHCLPWSAWPCGDLWNLLPSSRHANQRLKRDRLPSAATLAGAREGIVGWWEAAWRSDLALGKRFDREAAAALPVPFGAVSEDVFAALEWRRLRLSQDQQIPEWAGARSE